MRLANQTSPVSPPTLTVGRRQGRLGRPPTLFAGWSDANRRTGAAPIWCAAKGSSCGPDGLRVLLVTHAVSAPTSWSGPFAGAGGREARSCQGPEKLVGERTPPSWAPPVEPVLRKVPARGMGKGGGHGFGGDGAACGRGCVFCFGGAAAEAVDSLGPGGGVWVGSAECGGHREL